MGSRLVNLAIKWNPQESRLPWCLPFHLTLSLTSTLPGCEMIAAQVLGVPRPKSQADLTPSQRIGREQGNGHPCVCFSSQQQGNLLQPRNHLADFFHLIGQNYIAYSFLSQSLRRTMGFFS